MKTAAKLLEEAMRLPADEREELAATLLDSVEPPPGISIDDKDEIEKRAVDARAGVPGIPWDDVKQERAWSDEIQKRLTDVAADRVELIDADEVHAELRAELHDPHAGELRRLRGSPHQVLVRAVAHTSKKPGSWRARIKK